MGTDHRHTTKAGRATLLQQVEVSTQAGATEPSKGMRHQGSAGYAKHGEARTARCGRDAGQWDRTTARVAGSGQHTAPFKRAEETFASVYTEDRLTARGVGQSRRTMVQTTVRSQLLTQHRPTFL